MVRKSSDAISRMLAGESPISPAIATHLIKRFQKSAASSVDTAITLTNREHEVLMLAAKGLSYRDTADTLGVSINTVGTYTKRIYAKLAVNSRAAAIFEARQLRLLTDD